MTMLQFIKTFNITEDSFIPLIMKLCGKSKNSFEDYSFVEEQFLNYSSIQILFQVNCDTQKNVYFYHDDYSKLHFKYYTDKILFIGSMYMIAENHIYLLLEDRFLSTIMIGGGTEEILIKRKDIEEFINTQKFVNKLLKKKKFQ